MARLRPSFYGLTIVNRKSRITPPNRGTVELPVEQLDPDAWVHDAPHLKVQFYLARLLVGARGVGPPHIEVGIACFLNDEARVLEVRAQFIEEGEVAGS
jgi:hypothetical protein